MEKARPRTVEMDGYKPQSSTGDHRARINADERAVESVLGSEEHHLLEDELLAKDLSNKIQGSKVGESHYPKPNKRGRESIRDKQAA